MTLEKYFHTIMLHQNSMAQLHFKKTQLLLELVMEYNNIEFEIKKIQVKSSVHFAF